MTQAGTPLTQHAALSTQHFVTVIGGGLAGCEAAWQLARRGIPVRLYEMRPLQSTPAHHTDRLGELVCSNSFRSASLDSAVGLLKEEMRCLGSLVMDIADRTAVPAGSALAVDREQFAAQLTAAISSRPEITVVRRGDHGSSGGAHHRGHRTIDLAGPLSLPARAPG